ncbi:Uncharacterised protein [Mycobacteroides abscessus subsp. abscessus]|nr:Uncharacterised protein [Mycobacteroides abscessus subsp. abscessus]
MAEPLTVGLGWPWLTSLGAVSTGEGAIVASSEGETVTADSISDGVRPSAAWAA